MFKENFKIGTDQIANREDHDQNSTGRYSPCQQGNGYISNNDQREISTIIVSCK
jgi:hypothetical protein